MAIPMNASQVDHLEAAMTFSRKIVVATAAASTVFGLLYALGLAGKLIVDGSVHSVSSEFIQRIAAITALLWNGCLLVLFAALRRLFTSRQSVCADLASIFITLTCVTSSINWFIQLAVLPGVRAGGGQGVLPALLDVHNPLSITFAVEHLGWGVFFGTGLFFSAGSFTSGPQDTRLRRLLFAGGLLCWMHVIGLLTMTSWLADVGYIAWGILLPITTALLASRFSRPRGI